jgi:hypothetical protein
VTLVHTADTYSGAVGALERRNMYLLCAQLLKLYRFTITFTIIVGLTKQENCTPKLGAQFRLYLELIVIIIVLLIITQLIFSLLFQLLLLAALLKQLQ